MVAVKGVRCPVANRLNDSDPRCLCAVLSGEIVRLTRTRRYRTTDAGGAGLGLDGSRAVANHVDVQLFAMGFGHLRLGFHFLWYVLLLQVTGYSQARLSLLLGQAICLSGLFRPIEWTLIREAL